eukprot:CAMPEP_0179151436 /NCGR_PEP_ID=MMETSP0796-20121207/73525_1 /TAXON_ID=73915 /ORGANISM="Pyrodinium bahamense, Strain pbaha01" /LENGTH=379 /DNA_ID=CAMNT_0020852539 /DNA_START=9 /DNA_END=1148 /DNA_ORIENTATION=+
MSASEPPLGGSSEEAEETEAILGAGMGIPGRGPAPLGMASCSKGPEPQRLGAAATGEEEDADGGLDLEELRPVVEGCQRMSLYRVWPSQNLFCCGGALVTGGSSECWAPNICVWTMILGPCYIYFYWVFPRLVQHGTFALPGATLVVFLMTVGLLLATCCTDPGIIPRREVILATGTAAKLQRALGYDILGESSADQPTVPSELYGQGYRWCRTCRIIRPPRASHCSDCDNCVLRYDHHCPFVNNCVGQRNYAFFLGFITSVLFLAMLVIPSIFTFYSSINRERSVKGLARVSESMRVAWYLVIAGGLAVILAALLSCLLAGYHLFLVLTNQTTKEFRRSIPNITEEPTLCAPRGPRLFDPWASVDPRVIAGHSTVREL